jgi:hypothetical protein
MGISRGRWIPMGASPDASTPDRLPGLRPGQAHRRPDVVHQDLRTVSHVSPKDVSAFVNWAIDYSKATPGSPKPGRSATICGSTQKTPWLCPGSR